MDSNLNYMNHKDLILSKKLERLHGTYDVERNLLPWSYIYLLIRHVSTVSKY